MQESIEESYGHAPWLDAELFCCHFHMAVSVCSVSVQAITTANPMASKAAVSCAEVPRSTMMPFAAVQGAIT